MKQLILQLSNGEGWGKFYPDQGFIILNPTLVNFSPIGLEPDLGVSDKENHKQIYNAIWRCKDFKSVRRTENVSTSHYFVRNNKQRV